jgi:hypothetical protein
MVETPVQVAAVQATIPQVLLMQELIQLLSEAVAVLPVVEAEMVLLVEAAGLLVL